MDSDEETAEKKHGHICTYSDCKKSFSRPSRLQCHIRIHTGDRPFLCAEEGCDKSYTRQSHLKRHIESTHYQESEMEQTSAVNTKECAQSSEDDSCTTSKKLTKESPTKPGEQPSPKVYGPKYKCKESGCEAAFWKKHRLKTHTLEHSGLLQNEFFKCKEEGCTQFFSTKSDLNRHGKLHKGYPCKFDGCQETFSKFSLLTKHTRFRHKQKTPSSTISKPESIVVKHKEDTTYTTYTTDDLHSDTTASNINISEEQSNVWCSRLSSTQEEDKLQAGPSAVTSQGTTSLSQDISRAPDGKSAIIDMTSPDSLVMTSPRRKEATSSERKHMTSPPCRDVIPVRERVRERGEIESVDSGLCSPRSRTSSTVGDYLCPHDGCAKSFSRPSRLECHIRVHTGERPFLCSEPECGKSYSRASHLKRHAENAHPIGKHDQQVLVCSEEACNKSFTLRQNLMKHVRDAHEEQGLKYRCYEDGCESVFRKKHQLRDHMLYHAGTPQLRCPHKGCDKQFPTKSKLNSHIRCHQGYACPTEECKMMFEKYSLLRKHIAKDHKKWFTCDDCDKKFGKKSELAAHRRVHTGEKFACTHAGCDRAYYALKNLQWHIRSHHEGKLNYPCRTEGCEMKFSTERKLQRHMKTHNPDRTPPKKRCWANTKRKSVVSRITGMDPKDAQPLTLQDTEDVETQPDSPRQTNVSAGKDGTIELLIEAGNTRPEKDVYIDVVATVKDDSMDNDIKQSGSGDCARREEVPPDNNSSASATQYTEEVIKPQAPKLHINSQIDSQSGTRPDTLLPSGNNTTILEPLVIDVNNYESTGNPAEDQGGDTLLIPAALIQTINQETEIDGDNVNCGFTESGQMSERPVSSYNDVISTNFQTEGQQPAEYSKITSANFNHSKSEDEVRPSGDVVTAAPGKYQICVSSVENNARVKTMNNTTVPPEMIVTSSQGNDLNTSRSSANDDNKSESSKVATSVIETLQNGAAPSTSQTVTQDIKPQRKPALCLKRKNISGGTSLKTNESEPPVKRAPKQPGSMDDLEAKILQIISNVCKDKQ